jgi:hypothetical protein
MPVHLMGNVDPTVPKEVGKFGDLPTTRELRIEAGYRSARAVPNGTGRQAPVAAQAKFCLPLLPWSAKVRSAERWSTLVLSRLPWDGCSTCLPSTRWRGMRACAQCSGSAHVC